VPPEHLYSIATYFCFVGHTRYISVVSEFHCFYSISHQYSFIAGFFVDTNDPEGTM